MNLTKELYYEKYHVLMLSSTNDQKILKIQNERSIGQFNKVIQIIFKTKTR